LFESMTGAFVATDQPISGGDDGSILTFTNVTLTPPAVPEPSTWVMMALGFAGLGLLGYRKTRSALA
jgi:PEP-CTERM motif